jgi:Resolvase, N terminal domain
MTRVCLYTRISTDEDHQPTSLGTQRERLERYCQAMEDWHIAAAFEDQATGTTLERPVCRPRSTLPGRGGSSYCSSTASIACPARCASSPPSAKSSTSSGSS